MVLRARAGRRQRRIPRARQAFLCLSFCCEEGSCDNIICLPMSFCTMLGIRMSRIILRWWAAMGMFLTTSITRHENADNRLSVPRPCLGGSYMPHPKIRTWGVSPLGMQCASASGFLHSNLCPLHRFPSSGEHEASRVRAPVHPTPTHGSP